MVALIIKDIVCWIYDWNYQAEDISVCYHIKTSAFRKIRYSSLQLAFGTHVFFSKLIFWHFLWVDGLDVYLLHTQLQCFKDNGAKDSILQGARDFSGMFAIQRIPSFFRRNAWNNSRMDKQILIKFNIAGFY